MQKKEKVKNLLEKIRWCLDHDQYDFSNHAMLRRIERLVSFRDILYVLNNGHHEKTKDKWDEIFKSWNYAIKGKTIDNKILRIIVTFEENTSLLVITIIKL